MYKIFNKLDFFIIPHKYYRGIWITLIPFLFLVIDIILRLVFSINTGIIGTLVYLLVLFYCNLIWHYRTNKWYLRKTKKVYYRVAGFYIYYLPIPKRYLKKEGELTYINPKEVIADLMTFYNLILEIEDLGAIKLILTDNNSCFLHHPDIKIEYTLDPIAKVNKRNEIIDNVLNN